MEKLKIPTQEKKSSIESKEEPKPLDILIVLGKNWREYPPKETPKDWKIHLSLESKMSALAAGQMWQSGMAKKIIFSSGKTAGKEWSSEAKAMNDFLKQHFPDIPDSAIILEETSLDTSENVEYILQIIDKLNAKNAGLMTVGFHLDRAQQLFENYGLCIDHVFASEQELLKRSSHYKKFLDTYLGSPRHEFEKLKEEILQGFLVIDRKGKILRNLSKRVRG